MQPTNTPRLLPELLRIAHTIRKQHERLCESHGLTFQQFNVLRILAGEQRRTGEGLAIMTIRERLLEPGPGITRFVRSLEKLGWVETVENPADRRSQIVSLTPAGLEKLTELQEPVYHLSEEILVNFTADERKALSQLLTKF